MSDIERAEWKRTKTSGPSLFHVSCKAPNPKGVVGIVHGYADYAERYEPVMKVWAELGLSSVALDLRGHGRSGGTRGHADAFSDYLDDFRELLAMLDAKAPGLPRVLFAHSFGAAVSLKSLLSGLGSDFRAVALSEPYLATAFEVPAVKVFAAKIASRVLPSLGLPSGLTGAQMSTDADTGRAYDNDPLVFKNARARWYTETLATQAEIVARASEITKPLFVAFASDDRVASETTARKFFDGAGSKDKHWEPLAGLKHEPLNEPVHGKRVAETFGQWLVKYV